MTISLPCAPSSFTAKGEDGVFSYIKHGAISAPVRSSIEPVGAGFLKYVSRLQTGRSFLEDEAHHRSMQADVAEDGDDSEEEEEASELRHLEPKEWKKQDHYAVLGLSKYRWRATEDQIKKAYRRKVLRHHPDKKAAQGNVNDDAFFKCIQKANEVLMDETRRRQFDSCDPEFDESIPDADDIQPGTKRDYFRVLGSAFERNAHFSRRQPVPLLGTNESSREEVEHFYDFWYNLDSWRTFEYKDQDENEAADSRDDKRYVEKKNKAQRAKLKKEDNARVRELVDLALRLDPRMQRFKKEEKEAKEAKRKAKDLEKNKDKYAAEAAAKAEAEKQAAAAAASAAAANDERSGGASKTEDEKKAAKRNKEVIRKAKKSVRAIVEKHNYFREPSNASDIKEMEKVLDNLETIFAKLDLSGIEAFKADLEKHESNREEARKIFETKL